MLPDLAALQALQTCRSPQELRQGVDAFLQPAGVRHWLYVLDLPPTSYAPTSLILGAYPDAWVRHYTARDYLRIDPVVSHCRKHGTPYLWRHPLHQDDAEVSRVFHEAGEFGLRDGISIPLHGPGLHRGLMSFTAERVGDVDFLRAAPALHLLAHFVHEAGLSFSATPSLPHGATLTPRELECLRWAVIGKTSWEIGRVLAVSERTVVFHLQNASRKLGVCSRQAAVARARSMGLIEA